MSQATYIMFIPVTKTISGVNLFQVLRHVGYDKIDYVLASVKEYHSWNSIVNETDDDYDQLEDIEISEFLSFVDNAIAKYKYMTITTEMTSSVQDLMDTVARDAGVFFDNYSPSSLHFNYGMHDVYTMAPLVELFCRAPFSIGIRSYGYPKSKVEFEKMLAGHSCLAKVRNIIETALADTVRMHLTLH